MAHAEDLAYLRSKIGPEKFENWIEDLAEELRELEAEAAEGLPANGKPDLGRLTMEFGHLDVKGAKVVDVWRQPRPIRYRSKSA